MLRRTRKSPFSFSELLYLGQETLPISVEGHDRSTEPGVTHMRSFRLRHLGADLNGCVVLFESPDESLRASSLVASYLNESGDRQHTAHVPGEYADLLGVMQAPGKLGKHLVQAETVTTVNL